MLSPNDAYKKVIEYTKGGFKPDECKEYSNIYLFYSKNENLIYPPISVNKNTGDVKCFNPLNSNMSLEEYSSGRIVAFN